MGAQDTLYMCFALVLQGAVGYLISVLYRLDIINQRNAKERTANVQDRDSEVTERTSSSEPGRDVVVCRQQWFCDGIAENFPTYSSQGKVSSNDPLLFRRRNRGCHPYVRPNLDCSQQL
jgi:hypothetical protein